MLNLVKIKKLTGKRKEETITDVKNVIATVNVGAKIETYRRSKNNEKGGKYMVRLIIDSSHMKESCQGML